MSQGDTLFLKLTPLSSVLLTFSKRLLLMYPMRRCHVSASALAGSTTFSASTYMLNDKRSRVPTIFWSARLQPLVSIRESFRAKTVVMPADVASGIENGFFSQSA